jgi:hypothetical protein
MAFNHLHLSLIQIRDCYIIINLLVCLLIQIRDYFRNVNLFVDS